MKKSKLTWQEQERLEIMKLSEEMGWAKVYQAWSDHLQDLGVNLDPLFHTITLHDPDNPTDRESAYSWWPTQSVHQLHKDCQRWLDNLPGTLGSVHPFRYTRIGEITTLEHLWANRSEREKVAAILIGAWIFSGFPHRLRLNCPRIYIDAVEGWASTAWADSRGAWHTSSTTVLPRDSDYSDCRIKTLDDFVRFLAKEHATLLTNYRPVVIQYMPERDPVIEQELLAEYELERTSRAERESEYQIRQAEELQALEERKQKHPRLGQWESITRQELEQLVWSKPTTKVAKEFGVSDVSVGKKCYVLKIAKPPAGFWRKVAMGKLPHPQGKPMNL